MNGEWVPGDDAIKAAVEVFFRSHRFRWGLNSCTCGADLTYHGHEEHVASVALIAAHAAGGVQCPRGRIMTAVTTDGQANTCSHLSATGIDQAPIGVDKVWRCDHCGLLWTDGGRA